MAEIKEIPAKAWPEAPRPSDPRSTAELVRVAVSEMDFQSEGGCDSAWDALRELRLRGTREELEAVRKLCASESAFEREVGVCALGKFGGYGGVFPEECVTMLIERLSDSADSVVAAAGSALGHWESPRAIPHLAALKNHPDHQVRFGVVMGLKGLEQAQAIETLIELSRDEDAANRDWATFNLGQQLSSLDTPAIREALLARLTDADAATRGEAMVGLAERQDVRAVEAIQRELTGEFHGSWAMEAAEALADPVFLPLLFDLRSRLEAEEKSYFLKVCDDALAACQPASERIQSKSVDA